MQPPGHTDARRCVREVNRPQSSTRFFKTNVRLVFTGHSNMTLAVPFQREGVLTRITKPKELRALSGGIGSKFVEFPVAEIAELRRAARVVTFRNHGASFCLLFGNSKWMPRGRTTDACKETTARAESSSSKYQAEQRLRTSLCSFCCGSSARVSRAGARVQMLRYRRRSDRLAACHAA